MPSIGMVAEIQRQREAAENKKARTGFIAVHPELGVFLGIDKNKEAVFRPLAALAPEQSVPAVFQPQDMPTSSGPDRRILACTLYAVYVPDVDNRVTYGADILRSDGGIKTKPDARGHSVYKPSEGVGYLLSVFKMKADRAFMSGRSKNRYYQPVVRSAVPVAAL